MILLTFEEAGDGFVTVVVVVAGHFVVVVVVVFVEDGFGLNNSARGSFLGKSVSRKKGTRKHERKNENAKELATTFERFNEFDTPSFD